MMNDSTKVILLEIRLTWNIWMVMLDWMIYTNQQFDLFVKPIERVDKIALSRDDDQRLRLISSAKAAALLMIGSCSGHMVIWSAFLVCEWKIGQSPALNEMVRYDCYEISTWLNSKYAEMF